MQDYSPVGLGCADEELRSICIGTSICHRQNARACVLEEEVLISKLLTINGFATCSIMAGKVTTLQKDRTRI